MKMLIINSDALFERDESFLIHKNTGVFIDSLISKGCDVSIFHFKRRLSNDTVSNYRIDNNKVKIYGVDRRKSKIGSHFFAFLSLIKHIKKFDFLYLFYPNAFFYSVFIAKFFRIPYGIYLRGEKNYKSTLSNYIYRNAKFVTSISPEFTQHVLRVNKKAFTIKPMIDFDLSDIPEKLPKDHNNHFSLLYIGRVERDKGVFELIEALSILKLNSKYSFKLNIVGNGQHFNEISELISKHGLSENVKLYGVITDKESIKEFYSEADIFILPSHHEGFPRVLYEAMIFKVPIITTFVGSISYLMKDSYNCLKIEANNPESIYEKLSYAMNNSNKLSTITKNATKTVKDYFETNNLSHEQILIENI
jgi:glycosyltransferase involved in cell wall biosynthesis